MIAKEMQHRFSHYISLVVILSVLFSLYVFGNSSMLRVSTAALIGLVYIVWGLWSHHGEIRTMRLVLEYVAVGLLGAVILGVLAQTV